jgi:hypothetical protein
MIGSRGSEFVHRLGIHAAILAALFLVSAAGCAGAGSDNVVVIEKTKSYHRPECPRVKMAEVRTMTREEALALNCQPCPDCRPDAHR